MRKRNRGYGVTKWTVPKHQQRRWQRGFVEGIKAHENGVSKLACPYAFDSLIGWAWGSGWESEKFLRPWANTE